MGAIQDYPQSSCCSQGLRSEFKNSNFWALSLKTYYLSRKFITSFYSCLDLLCVSVWQKRNDGHLGEQDDYLSQGHPMSRGHPSQQWQHDPFSSAIWLSWKKGPWQRAWCGLSAVAPGWILLRESPSLGLWSRHRRLQRAPLDPSQRDTGAFSWLSVLWNAHGALCCRISLETAFREALLIGQVYYYPYNNIHLVKQREQQAWIQGLSLTLRDVTLPCSQSPAQFQGRIILQQPSWSAQPSL